MPIIESDRMLFNRVWATGAKAVREHRISALFDITRNTPTLEQYQDGNGQRMTDMIKVVQLGILQLLGSKEPTDPEPGKRPASSPGRPLCRAS